VAGTCGPLANTTVPLRAGPPSTGRAFPSRAEAAPCPARCRSAAWGCSLTTLGGWLASGRVPHGAERPSRGRLRKPLPDPFDEISRVTSSSLVVPTAGHTAVSPWRAGLHGRAGRGMIMVGSWVVVGARRRKSSLESSVCILPLHEPFARESRTGFGSGRLICRAGSCQVPRTLGNGNNSPTQEKLDPKPVRRRSTCAALRGCMLRCAAVCSAPGDPA
jgi:hypothetical protein